MREAANPNEVIWENLQIKDLPKKKKMAKAYLTFIFLTVVVSLISINLLKYSNRESTMYPGWDCDRFYSTMNTSTT